MREDQLISRRARQWPFSTAGALRGNLAFGGHICTRTAIRRLHHQGMRARRPIKRPQLALRHRHALFDWSHDHLGGIFAHGDGSTGLRKVIFCYALPTVVQGFGANETLHFRTTPFWHNCFWGWGVTVAGCFSFDCKLDLYVLDGNLTGQKYRDNVLPPRVVPHFANHALADMPMCMDDNARQQRARIVQHFFTVRGCSDNSMPCDVARHEPYRACMGLYLRKNLPTQSKMSTY